MATLIRKYKKYVSGGKMTPEQFTSGATGVAGALGVLGSIEQPNKYGRKSVGSNIMSNVGTFAGAGAAFGPIGAGVGALVGAGVGLVNAEKQKREEATQKNLEGIEALQEEQSRNAARINSDPTLTTGSMTARYYAFGGGGLKANTLMKSHLGAYYKGIKAMGGNVSNNNLAKEITLSGEAKPMSSDTAEFVGPPHEDGGIQLPNVNAEVEGKETSTGDYVFSDRLGFAKLHKKLAKAMGKIESKVMSPERVAAMKFLKGQENNLKMRQEFVKHQMGLA
jgi:hypothetical protein